MKVLLVKILLLIFFSTAVLAEDIFSDITNSADSAVIDKCVKDVNQSADDGLDTAERLYQTGMCHFCINCDFEADNGYIFLADVPNSGLLTQISTSENYETANTLITQAAGLGNHEAYYGLAVLRYVSELSNNRKSKTEILKNENILFERNNENSKQTKEDTQASVDTLINDIFQKSHKADFSQEIQRYLLLAAKQGYIPAQFALGEVYFKGIGVAPDNVQAYAWAATAVAQNPPFGSLRRDEKAINLDNIKLNQAEAIAEEYMKKYTNIFDRSSVTVMR
ncbi:MAG: hypothetical protein KJO81_06235 [Gammaproteobacteria bacterium]|nr:hypothetical protein [Gammaproteobacteria bacterium]